VLVLAGQVTLDGAALSAAGIAQAHSIAEYAGSIQLAMDDAANQLAGLARRTAADWA
jgi:glycerate kinase